MAAGNIERFGDSDLSLFAFDEESEEGTNGKAEDKRGVNSAKEGAEKGTEADTPLADELEPREAQPANQEYMEEQREDIDPESSLKPQEGAEGEEEEKPKPKPTLEQLIAEKLRDKGLVPPVENDDMIHKAAYITAEFEELEKLWADR